MYTRTRTRTRYVRTQPLRVRSVYVQMYVFHYSGNDARTFRIPKCTVCTTPCVRLAEQDRYHDDTITKIVKGTHPYQDSTS